MESCLICLSMFIDPFTFPDCLHRFCLPCLCQLFAEKINSKLISLKHYSCPQCLKSFDVDLLRVILPPEIYLKYCDLTLETNQIQGLAADEVMVNCLNQSCQNKYIISIIAYFQECPSCEKRHCRSCKLEFHPTLTCEQAQTVDLEAQQLQDREFYTQLRQKYGISRCPKCGQLSERYGGCNYIACFSEVCQGDYGYCYQCNVELTQDVSWRDTFKDHFSHYARDNPFGGACRVKIAGVWVDKGNAKQAEIEEVTQTTTQQVEPPKNSIPCPRCLSENSTLTRILLNNSLLFCQSKHCLNFIYCLKCMRELTVSAANTHYTCDLQCAIN